MVRFVFMGKLLSLNCLFLPSTFYFFSVEDLSTYTTSFLFYHILIHLRSKTTPFQKELSQNKYGLLQSQSFCCYHTQFGSWWPACLFVSVPCTALGFFPPCMSVPLPLELWHAVKCTTCSHGFIYLESLILPCHPTWPQLEMLDF